LLIQQTSAIAELLNKALISVLALLYASKSSVQILGDLSLQFPFQWAIWYIDLVFFALLGLYCLACLLLWCSVLKNSKK
jgi:hypothetical protein